MYNQVTLVGNLGSDVEARVTPIGVPVAHFDIAVHKEWNDDAGLRQGKTVWVRITCWRKLAETCTQHLSKGKRVLVAGELESAGAFIDREGNARATNEVTAARVVFLSPATEGADAAGASPDLTETA